MDDFVSVVKGPFREWILALRLLEVHDVNVVRLHVAEERHELFIGNFIDVM